MSVTAQRRGYFHADETAADDYGALADARGRADRGRVADGAQSEDAAEAAALHGQASRRRAGGKQQLVVAEASPPVQGEGARHRIDGDDPGLELHVDVVLAVEGLILDVRDFDRLSAQIALGQRGAVVRQCRLLGDEVDRSFAARFAIRLDRARRGQPAAGDHELFASHHSSFVHALCVSGRPGLLPVSLRA
jgi:hypothetical protein